MSQKTALILERNLPYTEKSEDVVDSECIKIFRHLPEPCLPPGKTVLCHLVPVVGRETPILSVSSECVRRSSRRLVHIEKLRILPSIHARAGNPDWKVTLENHSLGMGVFANF